MSDKPPACLGDHTGDYECQRCYCLGECWIQTQRKARKAEKSKEDAKRE
jgi:hypothetical protein